MILPFQMELLSAKKRLRDLIKVMNSMVQPVLLHLLIQMILMALSNKREDEMPSFFQMVFPSVSGWVGKGIIILASAVILTLSLTSQNTDNPTLLSWYFPVLIIAFWGATWIANMIFGWLVGVLARLMSK